MLLAAKGAIARAMVTATSARTSPLGPLLVDQHEARNKRRSLFCSTPTVLAPLPSSAPVSALAGLTCPVCGDSTQCDARRHLDEQGCACTRAFAESAAILLLVWAAWGGGGGQHTRLAHGQPLAATNKNVIRTPRRRENRRKMSTVNAPPLF